MIRISVLKTLINNGWTIANRRNIVSKIGANNFNDIAERALKSNLRDTFEYSAVENYLKPDTINETKEILDNISKSYKIYAKSPYINQYLREGRTLSEQSQQIVKSLKQAISQSKVSGKFVRGLTPTTTNSLETVEDVSKFIFGNKGFTSVVPEVNAGYANCFAIGRNGVKVIFDIKSMPGYKASNYEVLFDTQAFTPDKFDIAKIGENLYKVTQKQGV